MNEGKCYCGAELKGHKCCDGCGVLAGAIHEHSLSPYREHELCSHCVSCWKLDERLVKRAVTWEKFKGGLSPLEVFGKLSKAKEQELSDWLISLVKGGRRWKS